MSRPSDPPPTVSYQENAKPGRPCAPKGSVGHTADGTLVSCGPPAPNARNRWQVVVPPPPLK
ncbi:hypothetical protein GCM10010172_17440 [Paractinoplanes ferrugineus]